MLGGGSRQDNCQQQRHENKQADTCHDFSFLNENYSFL
jgi:hypothetical protein